MARKKYYPPELKASLELSHVANLILHHHEWWNGQGFPSGLKEEEIPMHCRILAIADAYDAMRSNRPYSKARPHEAVVAADAGFKAS